MRKRIVAFILVLTMVCVNSCMDGVYDLASYAEGTETQEACLTVKAVEEAKAGELVTIEVVANKDMYWNAFTLVLCLNSEKLKAGKEEMQAIEANYDSKFGKWTGWKNSAYKGRKQENFLDSHENYGDHCYIVIGVFVSNDEDKKDYVKIEKDARLLSLKAEAKVDLHEGDVIATCKLPSGYTTCEDVGEGRIEDVKYEVGLSADCIVKTGKITISFETNGGNVMEPIELNNGEAPGGIADPVKQGYAFEGWYTDSICETAFDETVPVEADVTLYAKWRELEEWEYTESNGSITITKYNGSDEVVTVPAELNGKKVYTIGTNAFRGNKNLKEVIVQEGILTIDMEAFGACTELTKMTLPKSLGNLNLAWGGLHSCTSLEEINVKEGNSNYRSIDGLLCDAAGTELIECPAGRKSVVVPEGITKIQGTAIGSIWENNVLEEVIIPEGVTNIETHAFWNCRALSKITLPNSVNRIEREAFDGCAALKEITLPSGLKSIEYRVFSCCISLEKVVIPASVADIAEEAFYLCNGLSEVILPNGLKSIGSRAFIYCKSLHEVTIPASVTSIGNRAFGYLAPESHEEDEYRSKDFVIVGYADTAAEMYARENEMDFRSLGNRPDRIVLEMMEQLVGENATRDIIIETSNGVTFTFGKGSLELLKGKDVYDFGTEISRDYSVLANPPFAEDELAFRIDYNYEGQLPGKAKISIPVDSEFTGKRLYYYAIGENGEYKYMGRTTVATDGTYTVKQNECSGSYVATTKAPENLGDCDGEAGITSKDALAILKYDVGILQENFDVRFADCDGEEGITSKDALAILKFDVGLQNELY